MKNNQNKYRLWHLRVCRGTLLMNRKVRAIYWSRSWPGVKPLTPIIKINLKRTIAYVQKNTGQLNKKKKKKKKKKNHKTTLESITSILV